MKHALRRRLPSLITFIGLASAVSAILLAAHRQLGAASICILAGNVLDSLDGALARRLGVASSFGRELDSLTDAVTFGVAPSLLVYQYTQRMALSPWVLWILCTGYVMSGVYRLARFNLLPATPSKGDSVGLTISMSGAILALSVLTNLAYNDRLLPDAFFPALVAVLALLMVSRIRYPVLSPILRSRWLRFGGLSVGAVLAVWLSPQLAGLALAGGYVSFGVFRSAYRLVR